MSNNEKSNKLIPGCFGDGNAQIYKDLVKIFSPILIFDDYERFFPVDIPSWLNSSSYYTIEGNQYFDEHAHFQFGPPVKPTDLIDRTNCFLTIGGYISESREIVVDYDSDNQPITKTINVPNPDIQKVYDIYSSGKIKAKLTIYATVCKLKDVPNFHFLKSYDCNKIFKLLGTDNLDECLLINYYFFFPAMDDGQIEKREGDWAGISILFKRTPNINALENDLPVLTCYYKKNGDNFASYPDGFCKWDSQRLRKIQDDKIKNKLTGALLETHPVVYISLNQHNCYYEPGKKKIPHKNPWKNSTPDKIENGAYNPETAAVTGESDLAAPAAVLIGTGVGCAAGGIAGPVGVFFGCIIGFFVSCGIACGAATGDQQDWAYEDIEDNVGSGGYNCVPDSAVTPVPPGSDNYPTTKGDSTPGNLLLKLNVVYVDLNDPDSKNWWGYKGLWGASDISEYTYFYWWEGNPQEKKREIKKWAHYGGCERPNLGPWFLWNLYFDQMGCGALNFR
jgi:hypothetical protein